jgi:hypothetical protein
MKNPLADRVATLPEEQAALVKKFIDYMQGPRNISDHDFQKTLDLRGMLGLSRKRSDLR